MRFPSSWKPAPSRPRRARTRVPAVVVERLEVRSLLSSAAVIRWQMAPQIALDPNHGNQPDLPNTSAYVNPPNGYGVLLDASHSQGVQPSTKFSWTVTDAKGHATHLVGEDPSLSLPQGTYTVSLEAQGLRHTTGPVFAQNSVQVKDVLIVSIGDSYASGEGNPVVPSFFDPQWAYSPDPAMNAENANAHRSTVAGPAQFALALQRANPHEAVTFVSVANSGASINQGLLGPMPSIGNPDVMLPAEIAEVKQIVGTHHIDALTVSVGANDVGFVTQVENLIENTYIGSPTLAAIQAQVNANIQGLPAKYAALGQAIGGLNPGHVLITDYPDLTRNQNGNVAAILGPLDTTLISKADAQFASKSIITPLDAAVSAAAEANHWTYVAGISAAFRTHGYPSTSSWIRQLGESLEMQGNLDGIFHPNAAGHQAIARRLLATYQGIKQG
jgi:lysophospholipase L1-like esterase